MTMAKNFVMFSTQHCTLCEQAMELLLSLPDLRGASLRVVDVADQDALFARYAEHVPVLAELLASGEAGAELPAPITAERVRDFLQQLS